MSRISKAGSHRVFIFTISAALMLLIGFDARGDEVFLAQMSKRLQIDLEVRVPLAGTLDEPVIHLFEIVKVGDKQKTFERTPKNMTRRIVNGQLAATLEIQAPSVNFDHFEVEIRNYRSSESSPETFRATVGGISLTVVKASNKSLDLRFNGSKNVDWTKFQTWITTAAAPSASVTIIFPDSSTREITGTTASNLVLRSSGDEKVLNVKFNLDETLPLKTKVKLMFPASAFSQATAHDLPLDLLRTPVDPKDVSGAGLPADQERDKVRVNVLEAGGSYNTSIKLDPDPTTNETPKRKKEGTFDLRLASPTITFADHTWRFASWTPAQLDAFVSNGKLTGETLSTNTIRAFTQLQQVFSSSGNGPTSFYRIVGEGGVNADRDLRTIEYTGLGDFRWSPGFLNRVLEANPPVDGGTTIKTEFIPIGVELGHRQVRRDPIFAADDFVRRLRFAGKFELVAPPYFEFSIENRSWWRGEFAENKFKNYFTTALTIVPAGGRTNFSAGIVLSYERGSQPPFTTQRGSILKVGFRVRRKNW